jgi:dipeptidyl-peptidase-4
MKRFFFFIAFISVANGWAQQAELTVKDIFNYQYEPQRLEAIRSMSNGKNYTVLEVDRQNQTAAIIKKAYADPKSEITLLATDSQKGIPFFTAYSFSKDESMVLLTLDEIPIYRRSKFGQYALYNFTTGQLESVSENWIQEPQLSPDGQKVAYVQERNLYVKVLATGQVTQLTFDGDEQTINGITDWVYEEEFGFVRAFAWNTASDHLAFLHFDESQVPVFSMDVYGTDLYPFPYTFRYPKAGEANAVVGLKVYSLSSQKTENISLDNDPMYYLPRFSFVPNSNTLSIRTLNRHQNHLRLWHVDVPSKTTQLILEEKSDTYVDIHDNLNYLDDYSFLWTSEKDGYNHIYHYDASGRLIRQLTQGDWEVTDVYQYNPKTREVYYASVEQTTIGRSVFAIKLNGKRKRLLSHPSGYNGATFSADGSYYIHSYSDETTPSQYLLRKTNDASVIRTLLSNEEVKEKLAAYHLPTKEFGTLELNGESLNMYLLKPHDFDPNKTYPLLLFQYSGPGSQQVTDRWGSSRDLWHKMLVNKGYIIACIDGRGTGFKGADFKKVTYKNLVKFEAEDQIEAARILGQRSYIDASRIGIWGWSFGGHMALQCLLTGPDVFSMAVSVAPVTNWRFYDTIYTERYMQTPQENPDGYDLNSPLNYADQLEGKLLIVHGSGDDNVHVQNTMRMVNALIAADKQFEWMIYPDRNHGIYGANATQHLFTKITKFIIENL